MSKRSQQKRAARQHKHQARDVSNVGGLFLIGAAYARGENAASLDSEARTDISIAAWHAFANIATGATSSIDDWAMIASTINIALILSEQGYGIEHEDVFNRALESLTHTYVRGKSKDIWRFSGDALNHVRTALDLHDQQCALVSKGDIKRAMNTVQERIEAGHVFELAEPAAA